MEIIYWVIDWVVDCFDLTSCIKNSVAFFRTYFLID